MASFDSAPVSHGRVRGILCAAIGYLLFQVGKFDNAWSLKLRMSHRVVDPNDRTADDVPLRIAQQ